MSGWVKLHRSILDWEWYSDPNASRLFIHCLLRANYEDKNWRGMDLKRGQFFTSLETLSAETGLSIRQARTALDKLESTGDLTSSGMARGRVVTVVNYDSYQSDDKQSDRLTTGFRQADRQADDSENVRLTTTDKKLRSKEVKNLKDIDQSEIDRLFELFWWSGIRRIGKKAALAKFTNLIKPKGNKDEFVGMLVDDVKARIDGQQFGFTEMHPTTYLNGERWNDERPKPRQPEIPAKPLSAVERVRAAVSEREKARESAIGAIREVNGEAVGEVCGDVREQVHKPIRGQPERGMGTVYDGDFWPTNG